MRTTIDLPDEIHEHLRRLAFERRTSLSKIAAELLQSSLERPRAAVTFESIDGIRTVTFGRGVIRDRDVREADDEW